MIIFSDGERTWDCVNVDDPVHGNYHVAVSEGISGAFNIISGTRIMINHLTKLIKEATGNNVEIEHGPPRNGDVRHSLADIAAARRHLDYDPKVSMEAGLKEFMTWAKKEVI